MDLFVSLGEYFRNFVVRDQCAPDPKVLSRTHSVNEDRTTQGKAPWGGGSLEPLIGESLIDLLISKTSNVIPDLLGGAFLQGASRCI